VEAHERALLVGSLRSSRLILAYGLTSSEGDTLQVIEHECGRVTPLDWRRPAEKVDLAQLRNDVVGRLEKNRTVVVLIGSDLSEPVRQLFAELRNKQGPLEAVACCIALLAEDSAPDSLRAEFGLCISGIAVIQRERSARLALENEKRAAQARARESSRRHGLV
jgi:hypothetical protein